MITKIKIQNFKCFDDFELDLKPFNVLVGPNDSGKTSFLQCLAIAGNAKNGLKVASIEVTDVLMPPFPFRSQEECLIIWEDNGSKNELGIDKRHIQRGGNASLLCEKAKYFNLSPSSLRMNSNIQNQKPLSLQTKGEGFPTFLEELLRSDRKLFFEMEQHFAKMFPSYTIDIQKSGNSNVLTFKLQDNQTLPASSVSDGAILYLAYLAVIHQPNPPKILLIEEPETGVHYASLKDIVTSLKKLCKEKEVQIVMTTHSPYLLDCVEPDEVYVFAKNKETGAVSAKRLSEFKETQRLQKHFMTGEIWTEYSEDEIVFGKDSGE